MTVDFPDWMTQAQAQLAAYTALTTEIAAAIATGNPAGTPGGVPLLHGYNAIQTGQALSIPANGSVFSGGNLQKVGYVVGLTAAMASGAATNPFLQVQLFWQDATQTYLLGQEEWYVPAPSTGTIFVFGKGPSKSPHMGIKVSNFDPAVAATMTLTLLESTHHITRDDWRSGPPVNVPGFTAIPGSVMYDLILGSIAGAGITIGAGLSKTWLLPLYAGQANISINMSAAANTIIAVYSQDPVETNPVPIFNTQVNNLYPSPFIVSLPRAPCTLVITNNSGANNTYQVGITALEYAS